jgi:hypothetical protein
MCVMRALLLAVGAFKLIILLDVYTITIKTRSNNLVCLSLNE